MLCKCGHLHINSDWLIVEPVDEEDRPVADGKPSGGILMTNLANLVQPVVRYRMSDTVVMHRKPCGCGLPFPYIEVEGRAEDLLEFEGSERFVKIPGTTLYVVALDTEGCETAQLIQRSPTEVEVRLVTLPGFDREAVKDETKGKAARFLEKSGLPSVNVVMSDGPVIRTKGGKMRISYKNF